MKVIYPEHLFLNFQHDPKKHSILWYTYKSSLNDNILGWGLLVDIMHPRWIYENQIVAFLKYPKPMVDRKGYLPPLTLTFNNKIEYQFTFQTLNGKALFKINGDKLATFKSP